MPFPVQGYLAKRTLAVTTATAKEAFAKAVEWASPKGSQRLDLHGVRSYSIDEFASAMALLEIAKTVQRPCRASLKAKKYAGRLWLTNGWQRKFEDPIVATGGQRRAITLRDAKGGLHPMAENGR